MQRPSTSKHLAGGDRHRTRYSAEGVGLIGPKTRWFLGDGSRLHYFEGDIGTICICNKQQCLHAASIPKAATTRDILQFEFYPSADDSNIAGAIWNNIPPDLEILEMRAQSK